MRFDAHLTHSNPVAHDAVAVYCIAISYLLNHIGDRQGAYKYARDYARNNLMHEWFLDLEMDPPKMFPATKQIGFLKIAFQHSFYYLKSEMTYKEVIADMLLKGGDTDTNAAIVGGLIGAADTVAGIPEEWKQAMLDFRCETKEDSSKFRGIQRPDWLIPGKVLPTGVQQLLEIAPEKLEVSIEGHQQTTFNESLKIVKAMPKPTRN